MTTSAHDQCRSRRMSLSCAVAQQACAWHLSTYCRTSSSCINPLSYGKRSSSSGDLPVSLDASCPSTILTDFTAPLCDFLATFHLISSASFRFFRFPRSAGETRVMSRVMPYVIRWCGATQCPVVSSSEAPPHRSSQSANVVSEASVIKTAFESQ